MNSRRKKIGYGLIVLWMFLPILLSLAAGMVANSFDCRLDEGSVHPCPAFGRDIGASLYFWGMMGWFSAGDVSHRFDGAGWVYAVCLVAQP